MTCQVSVIICHHKGNLILDAIKSLKSSLGVDLEIIVATSTDRLFEGVKTLHVPGGPAYKRNIALRYASYNLIAFFDDDIQVTASAVYQMAEALQKDSCGLVFGTLLNMEYRNRFDEAGSFLTSTGFLWARAESGIINYGQFNEPVPVLAGKSAACMIKRKVFTDAGMFDISYEILGEETDLAWRVWLLGHEVIYIPTSVTFHAFGTRFKPKDMYTPRRVYFNGCKNYLQMLITNLEFKNMIIPVLINSSVWFTASIGMLITGKFQGGFNILKGLLWVMTHIVFILKKRRKVQSSRKITDAKLLPIIIKNPPWSYYVKRFVHYIKTGRHG